MTRTQHLALATLLFYGTNAYKFFPVQPNLNGGRTSMVHAMGNADLPSAPGNFMDQLVHALDNQKTYIPNEAFWMQPTGSRGQNLLFDIKGE